MSLMTKKNISIAVMVIFHLVGLLGIGFQLDPNMLGLSWMNLLLTGVIVFINRGEFEPKFYWYSAIVFLAGLSVEIVGVATGYPFGVYHYGGSLGWKVLGVPVVLGLNWWLLVYSSIQLSSWITKNTVLKILIAPAFMVGLDFLIEPLCETMDFWHWKEAVVPVQNYLSWYFIALVLIAPYFFIVKNTSINKVAIAALITQALFFTSLNILL